MNKIALAFIVLLGCLQSCDTTETDPVENTISTQTMDGDIDNDSALQSVEMQLANDPDNADLLAKRAELLLKIGRVEDGMKDIAKAYRLDSLNVTIRKTHADYMLATTRILAARKDYNYIIEQNPGDAHAYLGMARTYAVEDNFEKAFQFTDEALKRDKFFRDAYALKGMLFRVQNKLGLAISSYQTAVEIDPNFYSGFVALGNLFESKEDPIAYEYYQTAHQIDTNGVDAIYGMAVYLQHFNQEDKAQELYRKMLSLDSTNFVAYYNQGWIKFVIQNDLDSATYFFNRTLEIVPKYADAWYNLGLVQAAKKNNNKAIECFKNVLKIDPNYKKAEEQIQLLVRI